MPQFRTVIGRFFSYRQDSADPDIHPDKHPLVGPVRFVPEYSEGRIAFPYVMEPEFAHPEPISAYLNEGELMVEVLDGDTSIWQPVSLMVTEDTGATQMWRWRMEFIDVRVGEFGSRIDMTPLRFALPMGLEPFDLTRVPTMRALSGGVVHSAKVLIDPIPDPNDVPVGTLAVVDGVLRQVQVKRSVS